MQTVIGQVRLFGIAVVAGDRNLVAHAIGHLQVVSAGDDLMLELQLPTVIQHAFLYRDCTGIQCVRHAHPGRLRCIGRLRDVQAQVLDGCQFWIIRVRDLHVRRPLIVVISPVVPDSMPQGLKVM
ncbi:hypothetical protein D3C77_592560 [compost metagenome]